MGMVMLFYVGCQFDLAADHVPDGKPLKKKCLPGLSHSGIAL
tara:strand:- start:239 stop:364 length:126 start_codon:yes stop_codon:yes gene_type:complete